VRHGRMHDLGRVLGERVPALPGGYFRQTLVAAAHHANPAGSRVNSISELVSATMQLGTHLDALSHPQAGDRGYGGLTVAELTGGLQPRRRLSNLFGADLAVVFA